MADSDATGTGETGSSEAEDTHTSSGADRLDREVAEPLRTDDFDRAAGRSYQRTIFVRLSRGVDRSSAGKLLVGAILGVAGVLGCWQGVPSDEESVGAWDLCLLVEVVSAEAGATLSTNWVSAQLEEESIVVAKAWTFHAEIS